MKMEPMPILLALMIMFAGLLVIEGFINDGDLNGVLRYAFTMVVVLNAMVVAVDMTSFPCICIVAALLVKIVRVASLMLSEPGKRLFWNEYRHCQVNEAIQTAINAEIRQRRIVWLIRTQPSQVVWEA